MDEFEIWLTMRIHAVEERKKESGAIIVYTVIQNVLENVLAMYKHLKNKEKNKSN